MVIILNKVLKTDFVFKLENRVNHDLMRWLHALVYIRATFSS